MYGGGNLRKHMGKVLLSVLCVLVLSGCAGSAGQSKEKEEYVIGVVTKSKSSEYWMSVYSGMGKAAKDYGVTVITLSPDSETDDSLQKKMIDDLIAKGVDALAVSPIQSFGADAYLAAAKENGIPVYSYDTRIMSQDIPYIGIDNEKAGRGLAEYMAKALGGNGKVGIISGNLEQSGHASRVKGFSDYIEENTNMEVAFVESGYSNLQMSEKEITRLMEEHPDVKEIFATSAVTALGIMKYMEQHPVVLVTVDAQQDALEAVAEGGIQALAAQSGYEIGYETIQYIIEKRDGEDLPLDKILNVEIITKDNVEEYQIQN